MEIKNMVIIVLLSVCIFISCQGKDKKVKQAENNQSKNNQHLYTDITRVEEDIPTQVENATPTENKQYTIKGIEQIRNDILKESVLNFCKFTKKQNYSAIYKYLSKGYFELLPSKTKIKTANQYIDFMRNSSEMEETKTDKFLKIMSVQYIDVATAYVEIVSEAINEGDYHKVKSIYVFKMENGIWKFDGIVLKSIKIIKTILNRDMEETPM
jgi:hypothetical protein